MSGDFAIGEAVVGTKVTVGPRDAHWTVYGDHGAAWSAAYIHGGLVRQDDNGVWHRLDAELRRLRLTNSDLEAIRACAPGPDAPPVWPPHVELVPVAVNLGLTWREQPLEAVVDGILAGTIVREVPRIGRRNDGAGLFYAGRVNALIGESGNNKTWVALHAAVQEIENGEHVIFVDFEDRVENIVARLIELGARPGFLSTFFHYIGPDEPFREDAKDELAQLIGRYAPTLVIIDSTGESMAVDGVKGNDDDAVARWGRALPRWIAGYGIAVVTVDHVTKSQESRGLYAIGSQRKRAAIDGAAYMLDPITEAGRGQLGRAKLTCAKDKLGTYVRGTVVAEFHLDATGETLRSELTPPSTSATDADHGWAPTHLMEKVSRWLEFNPGSSKKAIETAKLGKTDFVRMATSRLIAEGFVTVEQVGQAARHTVANRYREAATTESENS